MKSTEGIHQKLQIRTVKRSTEKINNTGRVERVLKLIRFLNQFRTINDCANLLDIHKKSVHRYLNMLTQLGFDLEVIQGKRYQYRIKNIEEYFKGSNKV